MAKAEIKQRLEGVKQTHGGRGASIAGIAGCITMKQRANAAHFVCAVDIGAADADAEADAITVFKKTRDAGASHFAHCMAHGVQVACGNRAQAIHTCRTAGGFNGKAKKAAKHGWCAKCVKTQDADEA